ncbi:hypothetical protein ABPG74_000356 [Tetrahymena malaccensis]
MDSAEQLSQEVNENENCQSSSSNLNAAHNDILGKIKTKKKQIFKLMKRQNTNRKKCSSYSGPTHNRKGQNEGHQIDIRQHSNSILNLPQNLSLEQKDSSINNNPSQNNLEDDELFSLNGSFCQSPPFQHTKDFADNIQITEKLSDMKISSHTPPLNPQRLYNLNMNPLNFHEDDDQNSNEDSKYREENYILPQKKIKTQNNRNYEQKRQTQTNSLRNAYKLKQNEQENQEDLHNIGFDNELSHSAFDTESIQNNNIDNQTQNQEIDADDHEINLSPAANAEGCSNAQSIMNSHEKKQMQQQQQQYSRREKSLEELSKKFLTIFLQKEQMLISLDKITQQLDVERRRIYDIINILESLKLVTRRGKNNYKWNGFEQIFDTIQFFSTQSEKQEVNLVAVEQNEKKEKSLEILSIGFLKLFLNFKQTLSLEEAARKLSPNNSENQKIKTKIRRLYDIANVFKSLGLIKKVQLNETKKPAFQWIGITGLQDFYNSSKDKEGLGSYQDLDETNKSQKINKKEQQIQQRTLSNSLVNLQNQNDQNTQDNTEREFINCKNMNQLFQSLENKNNALQQNLIAPFQQEKIVAAEDPDKEIDSSAQKSTCFFSNSKNSAFKRVSKSLSQTTQQNAQINPNNRLICLENLVRNSIFQSNQLTNSLNISQKLTQLFEQKGRPNIFQNIVNDQNILNNLNNTTENQQRKQSIQSENKKEYSYSWY